MREHAEEKLYTRLGELRVLGEETGRRPIVAVAGCVAQQEGAVAAQEDQRPRHRRRPRHAAAEDAAGARRAGARRRRLPRSISTRWDDVTFPLGITRRSDPVKAYVTIIEGCNDHCAFCVVPYTRGHERMRAKADILADVREAVALGPQGDPAARPDRESLPGAGRPGLRLRRSCWREVNDVAGVERIRFASPHPRHTGARLIEAVRDLPKVCKHLHLPVQSGSTRVLQAMRRRHTREEYLDLRRSGSARAIPGVTLSTDMIVGFPGETAEDFEETLSLTSAARYHSMFSFKYSPRPNTLASKRMPDDVSEEEKTARIVALQALQREIQTAAARGGRRHGRRRAGRLGEPAAAARESRGGRAGTP